MEQQNFGKVLTESFEAVDLAVAHCRNALCRMGSDDASIEYIFDNDALHDFYTAIGIDPITDDFQAWVESDDYFGSAQWDLDLEMWLLAAEQLQHHSLWNRLADIQAHGL